MLLQTLTFGWVMRNFLHNNSGLAILFAGILLLIAALATTWIKSSKPSPISPFPNPGAH
jgi:maltose/moltooligosaccharide transporter